MSRRDREITLDDLQADEGQRIEESEAVGEEPNFRAGVGDCWIDDARPCSAACMAYNTSCEETGAHPCQLMTSLQRIANPLIEQQDDATSLLQQISNGLIEQNNHLSQLIQLLTVRGV